MEDNKIQVYASIAEIQGEMSKEGIGKDNTNKQQGWKFRGIDDVYNAIAPKLSKHKLVIIPTVINRATTERKSKDGFALYSTSVRVAYDIVSAIDGSRHTMVMDGEAMDSGDKSTSKAVSIAYKYACFQLFCIPTEGDNDPDYTAHKVEPSEDKKPASKPAQAPATQSEAQTSITNIKAVTPTKSPKFFTLETEDGGKYGCSAELADIAQDQIGNKIALVWKQDGKYRNAVDIQEIQEEKPF